MRFDLNGKLALVTGGSRGIGREISLLLAQAGAEVIINYRQSKDKAESLLEEITGQRGKAELFQADVSNPEDIQHLFEHIRRKFNRLDILVNNAGIIKDNLLLSTELSDWDKVLNLNLRGAFLCTRYAAEMMLPNHSGKIINISSTGAIKGGRGQTNYAASKGGLVAFTRACAVELSGKGIQVNAVLPGMIVTGMSNRVRKRAGEEIMDKIPCGRFGEPKEVAYLVLFLASDLSDYITGQAIPVDGGLSVS
ncbi:MAG: 3-oxoacyl-ACP reductase FabG [Desulfobacterales bacterium]|jgi:3-oxoacyl-[acyl-carrier protein] reductase|nr:3-oxoacyl-ACP reductase FabG [Desulfobacterales bacterium]